MLHYNYLNVVQDPHLYPYWTGQYLMPLYEPELFDQLLHEEPFQNIARVLTLQMTQ